MLCTVVSSVLPTVNPKSTAKPQFAYLRPRSYREATQRVTQHIDRVSCLSRQADLTHHQLREGMTRPRIIGGNQLCLDVDGAFDKVSKAALEASMDVLKVPKDVASILLGWHVLPLHTNTDTEPLTSPLNANVGVKQGCVAAPLLWLVYTHALLTALATNLPSEWIRAWEFGDEDGLLLALNQIQSLLSSTLSLLGLRINMDKTQALIHLRGTKAPTWRQKLLRLVCSLYTCGCSM